MPPEARPPPRGAVRALLAGVSGLLGDYRYRRDGIEISGVFDGHSGVAGQRNDMGILSFTVGDHRYHLTSSGGNGIYTIGDTERLFYMPGDPNQAREAVSLGLDLLWLGLGLLALTLSIFGGKIARRLSSATELGPFFNPWINRSVTEPPASGGSLLARPVARFRE
jgi:hypothetical protein